MPDTCICIYHVWIALIRDVLKEMDTAMYGLIMVTSLDSIQVCFNQEERLNVRISFYHTHTHTHTLTGHVFWYTERFRSTESGSYCQFV